MIKQDWLDYFEAVNGRSATEAEIAQALAAGEFQEEQAAQEASQFVGAPVAPDQASAGFVAAPVAPEEAASQFATAPEAPVQEAPQFAAAPEAPVAAAPEAPVQEAPQYTAAPDAPAQEAPQFTAAPEAQTFGAQPNSFQQAPQQQPQPGFGQPAPGQAPGQGFQQVPYPGQPQPGQAYYAQPAQSNAFGQAMKGFWSWFVSALVRPTVETQPRVLNGILHYVLTAFILSLSLFFVASAFPYAEVGFTAYLLIVIVTFFTIYVTQLTGFLVRNLVLQDKEYTYKRSFDEFARLSIYALPASLIVLIFSLVKYFEGFIFLRSLIFVLYFLGLLYTVYQGLNRTKFKADKFLLLLASSAVILVIFTIVGIIDRRILEQVSIYIASFF
ncbi:MULTISPECIES: DUF6574 domain-containing protein [unclassified Streptococcus]|uniref:DUF6574 domain-containing protein n=1 Tax=unclassified Streptococcus TaxID=2608887 RepID=UPI001020E5B5|nr:MULTISPECIES: DUF6574 domain-containing protein [unclassified Streptococcus]MTQ41619.1 hypothetical protein [Streptococcus sp. BIOML-A1]RYS60881.1 hypothetical protein EAI95_02790 [Streptococcus sp. bf_0095]